MLQAIVANISLVPNKEQYTVDLILPNGLRSTYNKTLVYKEEMKGQAEIITENLTMMDRLFFNLKKMTERK